MPKSTAAILGLLVVALCVWGATVAGGGEEQDEPKPPDLRSEFEKRARKIGPDRYRIGAVTIDARAGTVRCPGAVNMAEGGPIELLACLKTGKVHESVLVVEVRPLDLQLALLLLGLEPGRNPGVELEEDSPAAEKQVGDMVEIYVEWKVADEEEDEPQTVRHRADELLYDVKAEAPLEPTQWVFVGSRWVKGRFGADLEGSIVTTFYDPFAILELPGEHVTDDTWCVVNEKVCPRIGTAVELIIERPKEQDEDKHEEEE